MFFYYKKVVLKDANTVEKGNTPFLQEKRKIFTGLTNMFIQFLLPDIQYEVGPMFNIKYINKFHH